MISNKTLANEQAVRMWYSGIQSIFKYIQLTNNWTKQQAWEKLRIELINAVEDDLVPDDLDWVKSLLLDEREPTTEEALRVSQRYTESTPLIDALKKLF